MASHTSRSSASSTAKIHEHSYGLQGTPALEFFYAACSRYKVFGRKGCVAAGDCEGYYNYLQRYRFFPGKGCVAAQKRSRMSVSLSRYRESGGKGCVAEGKLFGVAFFVNGVAYSGEVYLACGIFCSLRTLEFPMLLDVKWLRKKAVPRLHENVQARRSIMGIL